MKVVAILLRLAGLALSYDKLTNVAIRKPAEQKDTYEDKPGYAYLAVDGNAHPIYENMSCTHTQTQMNTWWMVDLLELYTIVAVNLTNRDEYGYRLIDFSVFLSRENPKSEEFPLTIPGEICFTRDEVIPEGKSELIACTKPIIGRYLTVFKPGNEYLTICEIEVLAPAVSNYRMIPGAMIRKEAFVSVADVTSGTSCMFLCRRAQGGVATAVQYRKSAKLCECVYISGFENSPPEWIYSADWSLFLSLD